MSKNELKAICTTDTVVLVKDNQQISIKRKDNQEFFAQVLDLVAKQDTEQLTKVYFDLNEKLKSYTSGHMEVEDGQVYIKGIDKPLPPVLYTSIKVMMEKGEDYMPLIRFWRKLAQSPHDSSIKQLYAFIKHNGVSITEYGDVVLEKGVKLKHGGLPDELVDAYTRTIDHSVGSYVSMPREQVVSDPNRTCAAGLHAAPASYVREWYGGDSYILVEIVVNPVDIVSVPVDYNSRKVRCCAYRVVGYSPAEPRKDLVVPTSAFITKTGESTASQIEHVETTPQSPAREVESDLKNKRINLGGMTAKEIVAATVHLLGIPTWGGKHPGRSYCREKAISLFQDAGWTVSIKEELKEKPKTTNTVSFDGLSAKEIVKRAMQDLNCDKFGGEVPRRAQVIKTATKLYTEAKWEVTSI